MAHLKELIRIYLPAVIVHGYLCDKEEYKNADKYFKEILQQYKLSYNS
jgi:hypothetical protein